jgi:glutathione S-transferase
VWPAVIAPLPCCGSAGSDHPPFCCCTGRVPPVAHLYPFSNFRTAIGEYLNEVKPIARLLPQDRTKRARCRSICGEMHSGFAPMRSALPMNLKGDFPNFKVWARAQADIDRITTIWRDCLNLYGGPFLLGDRSMADAMYAPAVTRFLTYHVKLDSLSSAYCQENHSDARDDRMDRRSQAGT